MINPTILLTIALALSVAANAWLFNSRDKAIVAGAVTEQARKDTAAAAQACSTSVDALASDGKARHADLIKRMQAQAGEVAALEGASIAALNVRPADPGDLCKSLAQYLAGEIKKERAAR
jgi:hypothetical protein